MSLSLFHPTLRTWFEATLGEPTAPQLRGWPRIREGRHTLIAAPTGSGKTLAAFLSAVDELLSEKELPDETRVLYVSPLRALSNDIQKNLHGPLEQLRERDPSLPEVRVWVRTGDTPQSERNAMRKTPPHILVTTPESLYILLTSEGGRRQLRTVRTVIVDEIHALLGSKRGSHLMLSLERLEALCEREVQRVGLSATQKPLSDVGRFLVGREREVELIDEGHLRQMDLRLELPPSPLETVCSHETWGEIYERITELIHEHRTTLIFVPTRKLAERVSGELMKLLGEEHVTCHHSSLSKERRLDAEQRLKAGKLRALVATASLELGIDIGDIDLVVQVGATKSIATFLQRVGRAGHGVGRIPKGRLFPLTPDELVESVAILRAVGRGVLDRTPQPSAPLDILAQQIVAACATDTWSCDELYERLRRAWPYRDLERSEFDRMVGLHSSGRRALLHKDGVNDKLRGTKRARLTAILSGGAIPDRAEYKVLIEPEGTFLGTLDEDFAIESSAGDIFQLGTSSWRVLKVGRGVMRVADAQGAPPSLPFWFGEAPARTVELSSELSAVRQEVVDETLFAKSPELKKRAATAGQQLDDYVREGQRVLGTIPTTKRLVLERFFDESGGTQLVLHAPLGSRVNRAFGLALRKRFCRHFGFELQAAANEDAICLSLGPQHSFPLEEVFDYLHPRTARDMLIQAVLPTPFFETRWRWNACRSLMVERNWSGKRVPAPILRMRADDLLAQAFPDVVACGENLPPGDIDVPMDHPLVAQTIHDCLHEAMDVDGLIEVLEQLRSGEIERVCVDTPEPSVFARAILNAAPYAFLDDAPLEERRTQAVLSRRILDPKTADELGELDASAVARVREEAWPHAENAEEVHEALLWMGYVTASEIEAQGWRGWIDDLSAEKRVVAQGDHLFAAESTRDAKQVLRGRLEALGPMFVRELQALDPRFDEALLFQLEGDGALMRCRLKGEEAWCDRRLLARIHRYTLDGLRAQIEPVQATTFLAFLSRWQHTGEHRLEGPEGVRRVLQQLQGMEIPAGAWEKKILQARVKDYRPDYLDELCLQGEFAWGRLWGSGNAAPRAMPLSFIPREDLEAWSALVREANAKSQREEEGQLGWCAEKVLARLRTGGALFPQDLLRKSEMLLSDFEEGLGELMARGIVTSDSFAAVRHLLAPSWKKKARGPRGIGGARMSLFRDPSENLPLDEESPPAEFVARVLLQRWGVVFHRMLERERLPVPWREIARCYRTLELRGEIRGGRFVAGFSGEQFALPEAVELLRKVRRKKEKNAVELAAADPLNLIGILTPTERVPVSSKRSVVIGDTTSGAESNPTAV